MSASGLSDSARNELAQLFARAYLRSLATRSEQRARESDVCFVSELRNPSGCVSRVEPSCGRTNGRAET